MSNALLVIAPYKRHGTWMFDDEQAGLRGEPFVAGIPEIIDWAVRDIPDADQGFRLVFSSTPFPGYQVELVRTRDEYGGTWYRWAGHNHEGWLCPALFKYFPQAPEQLYCQALPLGR